MAGPGGNPPPRPISIFRKGSDITPGYSKNRTRTRTGFRNRVKVRHVLVLGVPVRNVRKYLGTSMTYMDSVKVKRAATPLRFNLLEIRDRSSWRSNLPEILDIGRDCP